MQENLKKNKKRDIRRIISYNSSIVGKNDELINAIDNPNRYFGTYRYLVSDDDDYSNMKLAIVNGDETSWIDGLLVRDENSILYNYEIDMFEGPIEELLGYNLFFDHILLGDQADYINRGQKYLESVSRIEGYDVSYEDSVIRQPENINFLADESRDISNVWLLSDEKVFNYKEKGLFTAAQILAAENDGDLDIYIEDIDLICFKNRYTENYITQELVDYVNENIPNVSVGVSQEDGLVMTIIMNEDDDLPNMVEYFSNINFGGFSTEIIGADANGNIYLYFNDGDESFRTIVEFL